VSDEDDPDWFERALDEVDDETDDADDESDESDAFEAFDSEGEESDESDAFEAFGSEGEKSDESDAFEAFGSEGETLEEDVFGQLSESEAAQSDERETTGDPSASGRRNRSDRSADEFAEAFGDVGAGDRRDPDFGLGDPSGGDDFGFADFGGGDDFGFADFGDGSSEFDEENFESDIDRIEIGIEGLDEMILGGVPERSMIAAIGSAGTGKTTFGLQFLHRALSDGGRAVYITLEESRESIVESADEKGWGFSTHVEDGDLAVVDLHPIEMANSLTNIRDDLPRLIEEFGAERLVLDSVSLLEMMYDHPSERRSEVFEFARALKDAGVTTMVTSEASQESAYASRYGIIEYLADAVFVLQYVRPSDFRETRLAVEIQKIRDANHSRETKPYEITNDGISVYRQANIF
jgi:KaiC domain protein